MSDTSSVATKLHNRFLGTLHCYAVTRVDNAMPSCRTGYDKRQRRVGGGKRYPDCVAERRVSTK